MPKCRFKLLRIPRHTSNAVTPYMSGKMGISKFVPSSAPVIQSCSLRLVTSNRSLVEWYAWIESPFFLRLGCELSLRPAANTWKMLLPWGKMLKHSYTCCSVSIVSKSNVSSELT